MAKLNAADIAAKQVKRASESVSDYVKGVQQSTINPMAAAAAAVDKYRNNVIKAVDDGSYVDGLMSVSHDDFKRAVAGKGQRNYAAGVKEAAADISQFWSQFAPHLESGTLAVRAMPKNDLEDGVRRAEAMIRHNATFKRTKPRKG